MQGTHVEPGISQFRRLCATRAARTVSTKIIAPDFSRSRLFMIAGPMVAAGLLLDSPALGQLLALVGIALIWTIVRRK